VALAVGSVAHAQDKKVCDLLTRAEVESVLGVALEEPGTRRCRMEGRALQPSQYSGVDYLV